MEEKTLLSLLFILSLFTFPYLLQRILNRKEKIIPLSRQYFRTVFSINENMPVRKDNQTLKYRVRQSVFYPDPAYFLPGVHSTKRLEHFGTAVTK